MTETAAAIPGGERIGDFQILEKLGAGGMGVVYKATDLRLERTVALKFLPAELSVEPNEKELLAREAKAASALDHTNIGVIHGLEETPDGKLFIVMGFYDGETLAAKIRRGPLPLGATLDIACQVARGLSEAHTRHIVHRDIKPSNIMITGRGVAKIVDFGLARVINSASSQQSIRTSGTAAYMSPEQAMGKSLVPWRGDGGNGHWSAPLRRRKHNRFDVGNPESSAGVDGQPAARTEADHLSCVGQGSRAALSQL